MKFCDVSNPPDKVIDKMIELYTNWVSNDKVDFVEIDKSQLMSVNEVANFFGVHPITIRRWVYDNKLEYIKVNTRVFFTKKSIREKLKEKTYLRDVHKI